MKKQWKSFWRLCGLAGPGFEKHAAIALGAGLAPVLHNLIMAFSLQGIFAAAMAGSHPMLYSAVIFTSAAITGFFLFNGTMWGFYGASVARMTGRIRKGLFAHLCSLPMKALDHRQSAAAMTLFTNDAQAAENAYGYLLRFTVAATLSGIAATVALIAKNPFMGLVILLTSLMQLGCNLFVVKPLQRLSARIAGQVEEINTIMSNILDGNIAIRLYGMEQQELAVFRQKSLELERLNKRLCLVEGIVKGGNIVVAVVSYLLILAVGAWMVYQSSLSVSDLLFLTQSRGLVMLVVFTIGDFMSMVQPALASAERMFAFLDKPAEKQLDNDGNQP